MYIHTYIHIYIYVDAVGTGVVGGDQRHVGRHLRETTGYEREGQQIT